MLMHCPACAPLVKHFSPIGLGPTHFVHALGARTDLFSKLKMFRNARIPHPPSYLQSNTDPFVYTTGTSSPGVVDRHPHVVG